jgi:hypothetical protein
VPKRALDEPVNHSAPIFGYNEGKHPWADGARLNSEGFTMRPSIFVLALLLGSIGMAAFAPDASAKPYQGYYGGYGSTPNPGPSDYAPRYGPYYPDPSQGPYPGGFFAPYYGASGYYYLPGNRGYYFAPGYSYPYAPGYSVRPSSGSLNRGY